MDEVSTCLRRVALDAGLSGVCYNDVLRCCPGCEVLLCCVCVSDMSCYRAVLVHMVLVVVLCLCV